MSEDASKDVSFSYTGNGTDYFKLVLKNFILTILTLGFYSPWAKVQQKKYLCNSVTYKGAIFDFHADPIKILIGRIIVLAIFGCLVVTSIYVPNALTLGPLFFYGLGPLFILKSFKFKVNNTSYRNILFHYKMDLKKCYKTLFKTPIYLYFIFSGLITFVLFVFTDVFTKTTNEQGTEFYTPNPESSLLFIYLFIQVLFIILSIYTLFKSSSYFSSILNTFYDNVYYGGEKINLNINKEVVSNKIVKPYLMGILKTFLVSILLGIAIGFLVYFISPLVINITAPLLVAVSFFLILYYNMKLKFNIMNTVWNYGDFENKKFSNSLKFKTYIKETLINLLFIFLSLGFYTPFSIIKMQRLYWQNRTLDLEELDNVVAQAQDSEPALIEELSSIFDLDFDFSI